MHENNIFMFQLNLLLLHVEPQAPAKHDFDLQLITNISLFFLPFWVLYYEYFTFFGKIIFRFYKIKIFQNPTKLLRSENPSGMCAKRHTVAAGNNRDHSPWSLFAYAIVTLNR